MSEHANAPGLNRGAAVRYTRGCAADCTTKPNHRSIENQVIAAVRHVGALLENYATRQIALRQIGRSA